MGRGSRRLALVGAISGLLLISAIGVTSAAYQDAARITTALGSGSAFEVQARDAAGIWQGANSAAEAVVLPVSPEAEIGTREPSTFAVRFRVNPEGPKGDITSSIRPNEGCSARCGELFERMRFTVTLDGAEIATDVSAAEYNATAARTVRAAQPGQEYTLGVAVVLDENTPFSWSGSQASFGLTFDGVTT